MRVLRRARFAWRPWDVFFAQIEGDGQSLFCLMSISLLFYPLTPFVSRSCWCFSVCMRFSRFLSFRQFVVFHWSTFVVSSAYEGRAQEALEHRARRGQGQGWGTAGDGARALLPWTAGPGAQRTLIPSTSSRRTLRQKPCSSFVCLIQFVFICVSLHDVRTRPPTPCSPSCPRARSVMFFG